MGEGDAAGAARRVRPPRAPRRRRSRRRRSRARRGRRRGARRPSRACPRGHQRAGVASSSSREPWATIRPAPMITIRSATAWTSWSRCEESSTVPPRSANSRSSPRIQRIPSGSSPLAGSSRMRTSGSPSSACARPSRWRMPSEYWRTRLRAAARRARRAEQVVDALLRHADRLGGHREHLAPAAAGVLGGGVEQDADAAPRVGQVAVVSRRARSPGRRRARRARRARASSSSCRPRWGRGSR